MTNDYDKFLVTLVIVYTLSTSKLGIAMLYTFPSKHQYNFQNTSPEIIMSFQSMTLQRKLVLIFSAIGTISVFLPWVTISIFGETESVNGFRGTGIVVFLSFAAGIIISITGNQNVKLDKMMWLAALGAGVIALLFILISFGNTSEGGMGVIEPGHGFGIWLALLCSIGVLATAWFLKNPGDSLNSSFEGIKKNRFTANPTTTSTKMDELERLIELKNQGKITEEEYQEMKSKII